MAKELNKKELDQANGGDGIVDYYYVYSFDWTCEEANIYNQHETKSIRNTRSVVQAQMNQRKLDIKNQYAPYTVTFKNEEIHDRDIRGTSRY